MLFGGDKIVDKTIDEIRDLVGAVPKTDMYTQPTITLFKKVDKKKYIFYDAYKDLTKSKVPNNIKVLYDGVTKLIELTVPDTEPLEKLLNEEFKDKKYKTAIERKKDIRRSIYHYIFGPHALASDFSYLKENIDTIYNIKIKSVFTKGKKRLRNLAIKELEEKYPNFFENKRISKFNYQINVHPIDDLERRASVHQEVNNIMNGIDEENYDKEFLNEAKKIRNFYEKQIKRPDYKYYEHRKEMHAHMPDTLENEIMQAMEEVKQWEQTKIPDIEKAKKHNLEIVEQLEQDIKKLRRTYDASKTFKTRSIEYKPIKAPILEDIKDFYKILKIERTWELGRDHIIIKFPKTFIYKDTTVSTGYNRQSDSVSKETSHVRLNYYMYRGNRWSGDAVVDMFVNRMDEKDIRKYEFWIAKGIWEKMSAEDFVNMKPYFNEDIEKIKEIKVGG